MFGIKNRAIHSIGWGLLDNANTSGRAYGAAGSFNDLLNMAATSPAPETITFERIRESSSEGHPISWMHSWRGSTPVGLRTRRIIQTRPQPRRALVSENPPGDGVPGLLAITFSTTAGELNSLAAAGCHQLGSAGGRTILWRPIGDPRLKDEVFRKHAEPGEMDAEQAQVEAFLGAVANSPTEAHFINGEYAKAIEALGIQFDELPVIVFVALHPVCALAALHLDVAMFENPTRQKLLTSELVERLSEQRIGGFASNGRFSRTEMATLQKYLHQAAVEIRDAVLGSAQAPVQAPDASAYAMIYSHDRPPRTASKSEYLAAVSDRANYEFVINAVELYCLKPNVAGTRHETDVLTASNVRQIRHFVVTRAISRPPRPIDDYDSEKATDRSFQAARAKVDVKVGRYEFTLFKRHPRHVSGKSAYEFSPPAGTRWLYVEPIVREPGLE